MPRSVEEIDKAMENLRQERIESMFYADPIRVVNDYCEDYRIPIGKIEYNLDHTYIYITLKDGKKTAKKLGNLSKFNSYLYSYARYSIYSIRKVVGNKLYLELRKFPKL